MLTKVSVIEIHNMNLLNFVSLNLMDDKNRPVLSDGTIVLIFGLYFLCTGRDEIILVGDKESESAATVESTSLTNFLVKVLLNVQQIVFIALIE